MNLHHTAFHKRDLWTKLPSNVCLLLITTEIFIHNLTCSACIPWASKDEGRSQRKCADGRSLYIES